MRRAEGLGKNSINDAGGVTRDPEYLALNPNGLIPTISDYSFVLWESNAIVRHLCSKHGVALPGEPA